MVGEGGIGDFFEEATIKNFSNLKADYILTFKKKLVKNFKKTFNVKI